MSEPVVTADVCNNTYKADERPQQSSVLINVFLYAWVCVCAFFSDQR